MFACQYGRSQEIHCYPFRLLLAGIHKSLSIFVLCSMVLFVSCASPTVQLAPLSDKEEMVPHDQLTSPDYLLKPEDVVEVMVWKNPDLSRAVTIRPDGRLSLPLIGDVKAEGCTPDQLKDDITEKLKSYYQEPPHVAIIVQQVKDFAIFILGGVLHPGKLEVKNGTTFLQAVALAGGFTDFASTNRIQLRRRMHDGEEHAANIRYDDVILGKQKNLMLKPGDTIIVP